MNLVIARTMAFDHIFNTSNLFQCVDILRIISQELLLLVQHFDEPMAGAGFKLSRIYLACEFVEWPGILSKVSNVEHRLKIELSTYLFKL